MSNDITENKIEQVIMKGDLASLNPAEKVLYHNQVCESLGLNPLTVPFEYLTFQGKVKLYPKVSCAEQLRKIHNINIEIKAREIIDDLYVVTAKATDKNGRFDEATGVVAIAGLKGEARANAFLKAESKAKRRVTLSFCGLGMMDDTEVNGGKEEGAIISETLDEGNITYLKELITDAGGTEEKFCEHLKINTLEELPIEKWNGVCRMLEKKAAARKSSEAVLVNQEFNREESLALDAKLVEES